MPSSSTRSAPSSRPRSPAAKIKSLRALLPVIARLRARGARIVFTNGCFDILHAGHVRCLRRARMMGDVLIVAVNRDASVRALKGPGRPFVRERDRAEIVAALESVDYVVLFGAATPVGLLRRIAPDVLVKGGDYGKDGVVGADIVEGYGGRAVTVPFAPGRSTTRIVEHIRAHGRRPPHR